MFNHFNNLIFRARYLQLCPDQVKMNTSSYYKIEKYYFKEKDRCL